MYISSRLVGKAGVAWTEEKRTPAQTSVWQHAVLAALRMESDWMPSRLPSTTYIGVRSPERSMSAFWRS